MPDLRERLLLVNREQSAAYVAAEAARARHLARHPTRLAAVKCMDGRVLFPAMTGTPLGLVQPFRAIGGRAEVWWPSFLGRVRAWAEAATAAGERSAVFVTYHLSASDPHLGCAGWSYDTAAARAHAEKLAADLAYVFGEQLAALVARVETDRDELTLHGPGGDVRGGDLASADDAAIGRALAGAFPAVAAQVRADLVPLLRGNAARVAERTLAPRDLAHRSHRERVIALGQGFDWLVEANLALILNDADPDLARSVQVAAGILAENLRQGTPDETALLVTCVPYRDPGLDHRQAIARARGLRDLGLRVLGEHQPALVSSGRLRSLAGVLWAPAKRFQPLDEPG